MRTECRSVQTCSCPSVRYTSVAIYVNDVRFAIGLEEEDEVVVVGEWQKRKSAIALIFAAEGINATASASVC